MRDVKEPEVRKAEIMDAAIRLFTRKGYLNTTTQDIIDEVNISRGLLYYHFKNKEDILYCIIERLSLIHISNALFIVNCRNHLYYTLSIIPLFSILFQRLNTIIFASAP